MRDLSTREPLGPCALNRLLARGFEAPRLRERSQTSACPPALVVPAAAQGLDASVPSVAAATGVHVVAVSTRRITLPA